MSDTPQRLRFLLVSAHHDEPTWSHQLDTIRATGAGFENGAWYRFVDAQPSPIELINEMLDIARRFGTTISLSVHDTEQSS